MVRLIFRRIVGFFARLIFPVCSSCGRCGRPWTICEGHTTPYDRSGGCFPLCEQCWRELTPEDRLPYYEELFKSWKAYGYPDHNGTPWPILWRQMSESVMEGN